MTARELQLGSKVNDLLEKIEISLAYAALGGPRGRYPYTFFIAFSEPALSSMGPIWLQRELVVTVYVNHNPLVVDEKASAARDDQPPPEALEPVTRGLMSPLYLRALIEIDRL